MLYYTIIIIVIVTKGYLVYIKYCSEQKIIQWLSNQ
jgi:hypothetical protein